MSVVQIARLIDQAMDYAINRILKKSDLDDDFVDNELRLFFVETSKAKRVLLDVMLAHPEYVPDSWGGTVLVARRRLNQHEKSVAAKAKLKKKEEKESAVSITPVLRMTPSLEDFLIGAYDNKQDIKEDRAMIQSERPHSSVREHFFPARPISLLLLRRSLTLSTSQRCRHIMDAASIASMFFVAATIARSWGHFTNPQPLSSALFCRRDITAAATQVKTRTNVYSPSNRFLFRKSSNRLPHFTFIKHMGDEYEQLGPAGNVPPPPGAAPPLLPPPPPPDLRVPSPGLQAQPRDEEGAYEYAGKPTPSPDKREKKSRKAPSQERKRSSEKGRRRKSSVTPQRSSSSSAREIPASVYMALQEKASFNVSDDKGSIDEVYVHYKTLGMHSLYCRYAAS
ncbi:hypothetical protein Y032_0004g2100 [Ancylostoma ceylanicum]|uniref:DUF7774 domain-containing protein n=1 Tax=Ancylostoma ceylanicum TaxID=53326 RepID=A0A016VX28_9BILA|nr:hypothetical protein Y032_0004g2100 [Ancylostoma ceylanicum]